MKTMQQQLQEAYLGMKGILSEEDEQVVSDILALDELSKKTLGSYINKAARHSRDNARDAGWSSGTNTYKKEGEKANKTSLKRLRGIAKATNRLTKEQKESIESILDELSEELED